VFGPWDEVSIKESIQREKEFLLKLMKWAGFNGKQSLDLIEACLQEKRKGKICLRFQDLLDYIEQYAEEIEEELSKIPSSLSKLVEAITATAEMFLEGKQCVSWLLRGDYIAYSLALMKVGNRYRKEIDKECEALIRKGGCLGENPYDYLGDGEILDTFGECYVEEVCEQIFLEERGRGMCAFLLDKEAMGMCMKKLSDEDDDYYWEIIKAVWWWLKSIRATAWLLQQIEDLLQEIKTRQQEEGFWTHPCGDKPSVEKTALCTGILTRLQVYFNALEREARKGVEWLISHQKEDGHWEEETGDGESIEAILLTLIAADAVANCEGIEISLRRECVGKAIEWMDRMQGPIGLLGTRESFLKSEKKSLLKGSSDFPKPYVAHLEEMLLLSLMLLDLINVIKNQEKLSNLGGECRELLKKAKKEIVQAIGFSWEKAIADEGAAVIHAFAGVEAFIFALLSFYKRSLDSWGNRKKTFIEALCAVKDIVKDGEGKKLPYREALIELKEIRDKVIHDTCQPEKERVKLLVKNAFEFVRKHSLETIGVNLFGIRFPKGLTN